MTTFQPSSVIKPGLRHGVGVDLVSVERCCALMARQGSTVWQRLGCPPPPTECPEPGRLLAKKWAGLEAVWKATKACGLHVNLTQIEIFHDEAGRPGWKLQRTMDELPLFEIPHHRFPVQVTFSSGPLGGCFFHIISTDEDTHQGWLLSSLSFSDEGDLVTAFCSCLLYINDKPSPERKGPVEA